MSVAVLSMSDGQLRRFEVLRDVDRGGLPVPAEKIEPPLVLPAKAGSGPAESRTPEQATITNTTLRISRRRNGARL